MAKKSDGIFYYPKTMPRLLLCIIVFKYGPVPDSGNRFSAEKAGALPV
jgi:hypothetical protein